MFEEERFRELLGEYFDESLAGDRLEEFERHVLSFARAREMFWDAADHHALGREWALMTLGREMAAADEGRRRPWKKWIPVMAAACVAIACFMTWMMGGKSEEQDTPVASHSREIPPDEPVALLGLSSTAVWGDGKNRLTGDALLAGPLVLKSGTVRIDFYNGARAWVQGPTELKLISPDEMGLDRGILRANIPPAALGFRVVSGDFSVTDLGTEFGVAVTSGGMKEVHVFDGEVEVEQRSQGIAATRVGEGHAVRVNGQGWEPISAVPGIFPDPSAVWQQVSGREKVQFDAWRKASESLSRKRGMLVHYQFLDANSEGRVQNQVPGSTDGTLIGGEWSAGRWSGKSSVAFNHENDRLRLVVPGQYQSMTFLVWLRLEELPKVLAPIWRGENLVPGCVHWNIDNLGRVRMGVMSSSENFVSPSNKPSAWDLAISEPVMGGAVGRWVHLAGVYDSKAKRITLWMDGRKIASKKLRDGFPVSPGICQLGNSLVEPGDEVEGKSAGSRLLKGRMDEFLVAGTAFTEKEIRAHYLSGQPYAELADPTAW